MSGASSGAGYRERNATADRALDLLVMFSEQQPVISGAEIAERLGVARSTAYRYLQSLVSGRFLEEAPGGGFRLGLRVLEIARIARRSYGLSEVALPVMEALAEQVQETVLLTRRVRDLVVCLERAQAGSRAVRISYERGTTLPINAGASAQVLLAWTPQEEARRLLSSSELQRFTAATLTDVDALIERLAAIRVAGCVVTRAEVDPDVMGIAAPVRDENGSVVAAVSVAALLSRVSADAELDMVDRVCAAAVDIGQRLAVIAG